MKFILNEDENTSEEEKVTATVGNDTMRKLLTVIKSSNDRGYQAFINGIKGNINNPNFPFTKVMMNPAFSRALGIKEELGEADEYTNQGLLGNLKDQVTNKIKNSKVGKATSDVVNHTKDAIKNSNLSKKASALKVKTSPKTYARFATVYNTLLDVDDNTASQYADDKEAIIYNDPALFRLSPKDIAYAIKVDMSAMPVAGDNTEVLNQ